MSWLTPDLIDILLSILKAVVILLVVVTCGAFMSFGERRLLGLFQNRYGPNRVGWGGSLQLVADMIKMFFKEDWVPRFSDRVIFTLAPMIAFTSLLLAFASFNLIADQTIGGTALNLLAPALVLFFIRIIANQNTLNMASGDSASWFMIKKSTLGIDKSVDLGFFGETFINKVYLATYVCILVFIILSILLYKTRFGLRLRACGENPQAADSLGINVYKMRYAGTTISGTLAGMGGFVYALTTANCSSNGDVAGFGFLALPL